MKKKLCAVILSAGLVFAGATSAFAAYSGNAAYRELTKFFFTPTVDSSYKTIDIVHVQGSTISLVSRSDFEGDKGSYWGEYGMPGTSNTTYIRIRDKAMEIQRNSSLVTYSAIQQLQVWNGTNSKIEVRDIAKIRCDGLVEYCYEYQGVRLLGTNVTWNITTRYYHPNTHDTTSFSPILQMGIMTKQ